MRLIRLEKPQTGGHVSIRAGAPLQKMVTGCVLFEVRTELLNMIYTIFGFESLRIQP
jgi:hypothetical protein